ncbi:hypothetical protein ABLE92_04520 [Gordonia sp. VNQ95]|uniref:hypothetical protein n=1 Tax=Gordonia sp. VNQ95 TaxID=3156619 RepID=UPI0032B524F7
MTIADLPMNLGIEPSAPAAGGCGDCCGSCERPVPAPEPDVPVGFHAAITMAEAAANHNPTWWNEVRCHAEDTAAGEYCSSLLLGALLQSAAHRLGVPTADVWSYIRRTGELPQ